MPLASCTQLLPAKVVPKIFEGSDARLHLAGGSHCSAYLGENDERLAVPQLPLLLNVAGAHIAYAL